MDDIDCVPDTDAMHLAALVGVSPAHLGALAVTADRHPAVLARDPLRRPQVSDAPLDELLAEPEAWLVVPVVPTRRADNGVRYPAWLAAAAPGHLDGFDPADGDTFDASGPWPPSPTLHHARRVLCWPAAPQRHDGHRGGAPCERSPHRECFAACVDVVVAAAEATAERAWRLPDDIRLVVPPLLMAHDAPALVRRRAVAAATERVADALGHLAPVTTFAPSLTHPRPRPTPLAQLR